MVYNKASILKPAPSNIPEKGILFKPSKKLIGDHAGATTFEKSIEFNKTYLPAALLMAMSSAGVLMPI